MTLVELVQMLESLDDDLTIYAQASPDWNANSLAVAEYEPADGTVPPNAIGMLYFLEVYIAKEVLETYKRRKNGYNLTCKDEFNAVLYYAKNDAFLP